MFRLRRVGSGFVHSKRMLDNASISEPGQVYKNGSDSDPTVMIRATSCAERERAREREREREEEKAKKTKKNKTKQNKKPEKKHPIRSQIRCGKSDPANTIRPKFWLPTGRYAHNWPEPKRFRAGSGLFPGMASNDGNASEEETNDWQCL